MREKMSRMGRNRKGKPNNTTRVGREAIVEALSAYGSDAEGTDGMVGFCMALLREDIKTD